MPRIKAIQRDIQRRDGSLRESPKEVGQSNWLSDKVNGWVFAERSLPRRRYAGHQSVRVRHVALCSGRPLVNGARGELWNSNPRPNLTFHLSVGGDCARARETERRVGRRRLWFLTWQGWRADMRGNSLTLPHAACPEFRHSILGRLHDEGRTSGLGCRGSTHEAASKALLRS